MLSYSQQVPKCSVSLSQLFMFLSYTGCRHIDNCRLFTLPAIADTLSLIVSSKFVALARNLPSLIIITSPFECHLVLKYKIRMIISPYTWCIFLYVCLLMVIYYGNNISIQCFHHLWSWSHHISSWLYSLAFCYFVNNFWCDICTVLL